MQGWERGYVRKSPRVLLWHHECKCILSTLTIICHNLGNYFVQQYHVVVGRKYKFVSWPPQRSFKHTLYNYLASRFIITAKQNNVLRAYPITHYSNESLPLQVSNMNVSEFATSEIVMTAQYK